MRLVVLGASFLNRFAVRVLRESAAAPEQKTKQYRAKYLHAFALMAISSSSNTSTAA
jgi:hypothetical protein